MFFPEYMLPEKRGDAILIVYFTKEDIPMSDKKKGMLAAGIAYSIFGLSYLFSTKGIEAADDPAILLCVRFAITFLALNVMVLLKLGRLQLRGKRVLAPLALGMLQPVLYYMLENYGLKYTSTAFTGMVSSVNPIFTAILGALLLRERPTRMQWAFICVSIAGVMMVSVGAGEGSNTFFGCACLLGAYLVGSLNCIIVRRLAKEFTSFELTYLVFAVGFVFFAVFPFFKYGADAAELIGAAVSDGRFMVSALYLGILASVAAFTLANYALAKLPVAQTSVFAAIGTVVSVLSGVIIMHDEFTLMNAVAFVLMLAGVWGVNRFERKTE